MLTVKEYIKQPLPIKKELFKYFNKHDTLIILDIGACEALDSIKYAHLFPNARVFAFEPLPQNIRKIQKNLNRFKTKNVEVVKEALSNEIGKAIFHVSSGHPKNKPNSEEWDYGNKSSSLLAPDRVRETHPWIQFEEKIEVPTNTLKNFCLQQTLKQIHFIHMDVQGAELMVLEGARDMMSHIKMIWMEVEAVPLYQGQPVKSDVEKFMEEQGFVKAKDTVDNVAGDQLYINRNFLLPQKNGEKSLLGGLKNKVRSIFIKNNPWAKTSFAQSGEDLIIKYIFDALNIQPSYLDIGAHHPYKFNNTALFYEEGLRGINIEPDPQLFAGFETERKGDINLNIGISDHQGEADFYVMTASTLNTFSKEEAERYEKESSYKIKEVIKIKTDNVVNVINEHAGGKFPELLSIDVEGLEETILKSIEYEKTAPVVICAETITFSETGHGKKQHHIIDFLQSKGYMVYADTNINTIFVKRDIWKR